MSHSCFTHSSTDGHLGCFHILAIVNNTAVNIRGAYVLSNEYFVFLWISCIPRSGVPGSKGRFTFNVLRSLHTAFHSGCTNLHSHQQCKNKPTEWENIFINDISDKELLAKIYQELIQPNTKKPNNPIKNEQRT